MNLCICVDRKEEERRKEKERGEKKEEKVCSHIPI